MDSQVFLPALCIAPQLQRRNMGISSEALFRESLYVARQALFRRLSMNLVVWPFGLTFNRTCARERQMLFLGMEELLHYIDDGSPICLARGIAGKYVVFRPELVTCHSCRRALIERQREAGFGVIQKSDGWLSEWYQWLEKQPERLQDSTDFKAGWDAAMKGAVYIPADELESVALFLKMRKGIK